MPSGVKIGDTAAAEGVFNKQISKIYLKKEIEMSAINCKEIADSWLSATKEQVQKFYNNNNRSPKIVTIIANDDPASERYVRNKMNTCEKVGIEHEELYYKEPTSQKSIEDDLINIIEQLNNDAEVDGIMLQMPVFEEINKNKLINKIDPKKDVDCLTPTNIGKMVLNSSSFMPATVSGIMYLFKYNKINLKGLTVLIRGRSNIVGKPLAAAMINAGATVEVRNSYSCVSDKNFYDIVVDATGKENEDYEQWYCSYYIDVTTIVKNGKLQGSLKNINAPIYYTTVPKGVGLLTCAGLAANVIELINQK